MLNINVDRILKRKYITGKDLYQDFLDLMVWATDSKIGYLHQFDEKSQTFEFDIWSKEILKVCSTSLPEKCKMDDADVWADSVKNRKFVIQNKYKKLFPKQKMQIDHVPISTHISFPLFSKDHEIVGILGLGNGKIYSVEEAESIESFLQKYWIKFVKKSNDIDEHFNSLVLEFNRQTNNEVLFDLISSISKALELKDEYTHYHQQNVAYISERIANKLNMPVPRLIGLKLGAMLHDIGKMTLPSEVLNKVGKLMKEELSLLKTHANTGGEIFQNTSFPWPIREMILQHHERIDGSGYPKKLKGDKIILEAKIIAVADTYDAMASARPYRNKLGFDKAINTIKEGRMIKFDPYVVDAFLACVEEDPTFLGRYK